MQNNKFPGDKEQALGLLDQLRVVRTSYPWNQKTREELLELERAYRQKILDPTVEWVQVDVPNMGEPEKEEVKKEEKKEKEETNVADYYASMIGISGNSVTSYMKGPLLIQETHKQAQRQV
jgi:hypothetical protein